MKLGKLDSSTTLLVLSNIITIILAVLFNWNIMIVLWVYWLQNIIIGFFTVLKMIFYGKKQKTGLTFLTVFYTGFFIFHYGIFHLVYAGFLGSFTTFALLFGTLDLMSLLELFPIGMMFFLTHGYSFYKNYMQKPSDFRYFKNAKEIMFQPYIRIIPMHFTIILGVFTSFLLPFIPNVQLVFFLILKTVADVYSHLREHKRRLLR